MQLLINYFNEPNQNQLQKITSPWNPLWCSNPTGWCFRWINSVSTLKCWSTRSFFLSFGPTPCAFCGICILAPLMSGLLIVAAFTPSRWKKCKWTRHRLACLTLSHMQMWSWWSLKENPRLMGALFICLPQRAMRI